MIHAIIDGIPVEVEPGTTILKAAQSVGVKIPTLCYLKFMTPEASCRICMVEIEGMPKLVTACSFPIAEGNVIHTKSEKVIKSRRGVLELMLSNHPNDCFACPGNGDCEFQRLCFEYDVKTTRFAGEMVEKPIDESNPYFTYNPNLCILCHRCVNTCKYLVGQEALSTVNRGFASKIAAAPFGDVWINNKECEFCGNCVQACPVGALRPKNRSKYRPWEVTKVLATCYNCKNGNGCQRYLLVKDGEIVDVVAKEDEPNQGRICNKGRFEFYDVETPAQVEINNKKQIEKYRKALLATIK